MIIYHDFLSDGEMFSDSFKVIKVNDFIWEVEGKSITVKEGVDGALLGANPSAEEAEEIEDGVITAIDLVYAHQLQESSPGSKKYYMDFLKDYLKKLKAKMEAEKVDETTIAKFMKESQAYVKDKLLSDFNNLTFYQPKTSSDEFYFIPMNYRDDESTPYFVFFANGLKEEKV
ncbi:tRNA 2'-phosphotransferase [Sparganum proliferum]